MKKLPWNVGYFSKISEVFSTALTAQKQHKYNIYLVWIGSTDLQNSGGLWPPAPSSYTSELEKLTLKQISLYQAYEFEKKQ